MAGLSSNVRIRSQSAIGGQHHAADHVRVGEIAQVAKPLQKVRSRSSRASSTSIGIHRLPRALRTSEESGDARTSETYLLSVNRSTTPRYWSFYSPVKRSMDVVGSLVLIILFSPLMAMIALAIKLTSPGAIIFRQSRLTAGGKVFTMFKFRSMVENAEARSGAVWASEGDPRVTRLGYWLRRFRFDELPQLFNVLSGDMSLIGPRPERPELARELRCKMHSFDKRLSVRAGITGLAQVGHGYVGTVEGYKRKLALDLVYVRNCCFLLDCRIAMRTLLVMITGTGAR